MTALRSIAMAFSMFSRVPMPAFPWTEKNMRYMLSALPLVGLLIGLLLYAWMLLSRALALNSFLSACGLCLIPILVSGGIHLDGFADTLDALASHGSAERKREILKDPHIGLFAVLGLIAYVLLYFCLCTALNGNRETALCLAFIQMQTRACGGLAVLCLPSNKGGGSMDLFRRAGAKASLAILGASILGLTLLGIFLVGAAIALLLVAVLCCFVYLLYCCKQFEGMSGDLAGFNIQQTELAMLGALVLIQKVGLL